LLAPARDRPWPALPAASVESSPEYPLYSTSSRANDNCAENFLYEAARPIPVKFFPHREFKYYSFGLHAGFSNLFSNGARLGAKKTVGKITQPINAYSRFPEYYWFDEAIRHHELSTAPGQQTKILDVGSPKMLGLYLGFSTQAKMTLTDITELNVDEYRTMWRGMEAKARGKVVFALQDARSLEYGDAEFDVVYSMSVIEHIEGKDGDSRAMCELVRVLKPGGLLVISVPFGPHYVEQLRIGVSGAARKTGDQEAYFFQRIYDAPEFQERILKHTAGLKNVTLTTVWRRNQWLARIFGMLGENVRGMLGFVNPLLSVAINRSTKGISIPSRVSYGQVHNARNVYADLILTGLKQ
jgi:SAM-dependent methyltransferase